MRVHITIKGGMTRPSYEGYVDIPSFNDPLSLVEIKWLVIKKLNRTSYSVDKLRPSEVVVHSIDF